MIIWENTDEYLFGKTKNFCYSEKIASFDLDKTLITTKSNKPFPIDENDWKLYNENIEKKLKEFVKKKFCVIVISNQGGLKSDLKKKEWMTKLDCIQKTLNIEMLVFCSTNDNIFRKPLPMFFFNEIFFPQNIFTNKHELSFYCGDACGRKGDHSDTDLKFALNCNLQFKTPEMLFKNEEPNFSEIPNYPDINLILNSESNFTFKPSIDPEIIIMVGFPASGKSSISSILEKQHNYIIINQDTLKTKTKCIKFALENIKQKKSLVIDNTNKDKETRSDWIKIAKKNNYKIRCILLNVDKAQAMHNNKYRYLTTGKYISKIVYNIYSSKYETPDFSEGFEDIIIVDKYCKLVDFEKQDIYSMYLY